MILEACIKRVLFLGIFFLITSSVQAQVTTGKIIFERKTNLKKRMGDNPRMKNMITEENKYRIENFELFFNDSNSVFKPIESDEPSAEGFLKYFTTRNTVYQNINSREKYIEMDLFGTPAYIKDTMETRYWKITDSKRMLAGYNCRKAIWQMNDSTRIYAWFSPDIVPSVGPEGFEGLPGAILGLATEDGSVIYFAKEVTTADVPAALLKYNDKGKNVYTEKALMEELKAKMGQWVKPKDLEAMFSWL